MVHAPTLGPTSLMHFDDAAGQLTNRTPTPANPASSLCVAPMLRRASRMDAARLSIRSMCFPVCFMRKGGSVSEVNVVPPEEYGEVGFYLSRGAVSFSA